MRILWLKWKCTKLIHQLSQVEIVRFTITSWDESTLYACLHIYIVYSIDWWLFRLVDNAPKTHTHTHKPLIALCGLQQLHAIQKIISNGTTTTINYFRAIPIWFSSGIYGFCMTWPFLWSCPSDTYPFVRLRIRAKDEFSDVWQNSIIRMCALRMSRYHWKEQREKIHIFHDIV